MYKIDFDEKARLLTLRQSGFWTVEMVNRYVDEVDRTVVRLHRHCPRFDILSDNREFHVQSSEVIKAFSEASERAGSKHNGRVAILSSSTLAKLQAQRGITYPNVKRFLDEKEARAWLAS